MDILGASVLIFIVLMFGISAFANALEASDNKRKREED